jgi:hypothetical protein
VFDLCHKYILYLYLYFGLPEFVSSALQGAARGPEAVAGVLAALGALLSTGADASRLVRAAAGACVQIAPRWHVPNQIKSNAFSMYQFDRSQAALLQGLHPIHRSMLSKAVRRAVGSTAAAVIQATRRASMAHWRSGVRAHPVREAANARGTPMAAVRDGGDEGVLPSADSDKGAAAAHWERPCDHA